MNVCINFLSNSYIYPVYQNAAVSQKETDDLCYQKYVQNIWKLM